MRYCSRKCLTTLNSPRLMRSSSSSALTTWWVPVLWLLPLSQQTAALSMMASRLTMAAGCPLATWS
jgi:hypothetical protein